MTNRTIKGHHCRLLGSEIKAPNAVPNDGLNPLVEHLRASLTSWGTND